MLTRVVNLEGSEDRNYNINQQRKPLSMPPNCISLCFYFFVFLVKKSDSCEGARHVHKFLNIPVRDFPHVSERDNTLGEKNTRLRMKNDLLYVRIQQTTNKEKEKIQKPKKYRFRLYLSTR
eukprot:GDKJ01021883.1.p2 GENE.GDKJ01021883.1~~GDKJ01021883.1.p2  ORF type:complete len:121 (+),score=3.59 GDKJ01021883.1:601-963(+)